MDNYETILYLYHMPDSTTWTLIGGALVTGVGLLTAPLDGGITVATGVVGVMTGLEKRRQEYEDAQEAEAVKDAQLKQTEQELRKQKLQTAELQRQALEIENRKIAAEN